MTVSICYGCTTALTICITAIVTILSYFSSTDSKAFISKIQSNTIIQSEKTDGVTLLAAFDSY